MRDFQRKYENNGFVSQESAQQQQARLMKQQQELQQLQEKLHLLLWHFVEHNQSYFLYLLKIYLKV
jgi:hypothetical protein